jgi:hypothetical protein
MAPRWHAQHVKKLLIAAALLVGLVFLARRVAAGCGSIDWEQRVAAMPDNAPPKWMFNNIRAIRENTERVLELLERSPSGDDGIVEDGAGSTA